MTKTLVSVSVSGIGDRIRLMLSARSLAKQTGREFLHVWEPNGHCGAYFEQLFSCKEPIVTPVDPWANVSLFNFKTAPWEEVAEFVSKSNEEIVKIHSYMGCFNQHDFGSVVTFNGKVALKAEAFYRQRPFWTGCHVRGTDYRWRTPPMVDYFKALKDIGGCQPFFLATDEFKIRDEFKSEFGDRVLTYPISRFDRGLAETTVESAVELYLLRKCTKLVLSGWSEFSHLACKHQPPEWSPGVVITNNL